MWKLGTYLIMLAVPPSSRRHRGSKERKCNTYIKKFAKTEEMQKHMRDVHPNISVEKLSLNKMIDKESQSPYPLADKTIACNN
jgi:hypothetical protein